MFRDINSPPTRSQAVAQVAYDKGRHDFQSATRRSGNPYLRTNYTASYAVNVVGWYNGWDTEHDKARGGTR